MFFPSKPSKKDILQELTPPFAPWRRSVLICYNQPIDSSYRNTETLSPLTVNTFLCSMSYIRIPIGISDGSERLHNTLPLFDQIRYVKGQTKRTRHYYIHNTTKFLTLDKPEELNKTVLHNLDLTCTQLVGPYR